MLLLVLLWVATSRKLHTTCTCVYTTPLLYEVKLQLASMVQQYFVYVVATLRCLLIVLNTIALLIMHAGLLSRVHPASTRA